MDQPQPRPATLKAGRVDLVQDGVAAVRLVHTSPKGARTSVSVPLAQLERWAIRQIRALYFKP